MAGVWGQSPHYKSVGDTIIPHYYPLAEEVAEVPVSVFAEAAWLVSEAV